MMTIQQAIKQWFKYRKTSDYQYVQAAVSPILYGSEQLMVMYRNAATPKQKECLMEHLVRHDVITMKYSDYRKLYDKLYDEFAQ